MGGGSLAIVEKKPQFGSGAGGGCAGGVLFHLLDWHRRLVRKRRLFSPRRLLPAAVRSSSSSSTRRLPPPPPSPAQPPYPAPSKPDGPAAPGVVARLMGLDHWPSAASPAAGPRPQKQRKVETAPPPPEQEGGTVSEVVVMVPQTRLPPAHAHAPPRSHHSADLPARSPRRARFVHAAAARLLEPAGARAGSRARLAYACSSPQHRGHSGGTLEDFLARSDSPADAGRDNAFSSRWQHMQRSIDTMSSSAAATDAGVEMSGGTDTIVVPRTDFGDANRSTNTSDEDALRKDNSARNGGMGSCAGVRSSSAGGSTARAGEQRLLRKRGTFCRPDAQRSVGSGNLASLTCSIGNARELAPGGSSRRTANNSGPRRESMSSITLPRSNRRDMIDRTGSASTSRNASNASGPRRGSTHKKIDRGTGTAGSNSRGERNAAAFASSSSSVRPVSRTSSLGKVSDKRELRGTQSETSCCTRMPVVDAKCLEAEHCVVGATSEKEEFSRLLKAKIDELGLSDKVEPSDSDSANLTVSLLQELISALTDDTNTSASQSSNGSDSAPLNNAETVCNSSDQSPEFHKCYEFQGDQEPVFSVTCMNEETNRPSPTSVLEACFSNDASSLGSPVEKNEGKEFFVSVENKMEDLFNLESDIVDLAMSVDSTKTDAHGGSEMPCVASIAAQDFKFLECRLHSIGEAISNAELLLDGSLFCGTPLSLSLHSFIVEMLETVEGFCCHGPESLGFKEENRYQRTNFLFDCIVESLDSKFRNFGKCGYKAWLRLPLILRKGLLKREISEEISSWRNTTGGNPSNRAAEKELDQVAAGWDACRVEAFDISIAIEDDILEALVGEFAFDQC